jgi:DNA-binding transcriptional ArsR family regulator
MPNDHLSTTLAALADPTRRAILARLARRDLSVNEIAAPYSMSLPAISKHLKVLENAGLISRVRDAQFRPCHLEGAPLEPVSAWLDDFRRFWDDSLDAMEAVLEQIKRDAGSAKKATSRRKRKTK